MPVTADQWAVAQSWIGTTEDQATFNGRYDRAALLYGDKALNRAIEESIRAQMSVLMFDQPAQVTLPGGLSINYQANLQSLQERYKEFKAFYGSLAARTVRIRRPPDR